MSRKKKQPRKAAASNPSERPQAHPPAVCSLPGARGVAIYHVVYVHEDFDDAARKLVELIKHAQKNYPGRPRHLYLDIEGHRNTAGGFDRDMFELQGPFGVKFLMQWLTSFHCPIAGIQRAPTAPPQDDDIPDVLLISEQQPAGPFGEGQVVDGSMGADLPSCYTQRADGSIRYTSPFSTETEEQTPT